ncbi:MAG TPA: hypothetical protein VF707_11995 [Ardenticatenaceae bacterium]|jgi:hypothetical protein
MSTAPVPPTPDEAAERQPVLAERRAASPFSFFLSPFSLFLLAAVAVLTWAGAREWPGAITSTDVNQHRLDTALPPLAAGVEVRQTFRPRHDGLTEVELLLAKYGEEAAQENGGALTFQLLDEQGRVLAEQVEPSGGLAHNQSYVLRVPRQEDSGGRAYTLRMSADGPTLFSAWGYSLDVYDGGALVVSGAETAARELRFVTRYELTAGSAAASLLGSLRRDGPVMLLALMWALMPGCLLLLAALPRSLRWDAGAWWGVALALGLSAWPLGWYWLTLAGGQWSGWGLWLVLALGWGATLFLWLRRRRVAHAEGYAANDAAPPSATSFATPSGSSAEDRAGLRPIPTDRWRWEHGALALILVGGLAVRLLAVRDLGFPPWVDSIRHALITTLMVEHGQTISNYEPVLPIARFPYHFGFHTLPASLLLMTGWPLPETLLALGQLLNALVALTVYAAAWLVTRRRGAGLAAAFLVTFPFLFPAYYATWGRFTQGTAMVVMPVLVACVWGLVRGGRGWRGAWWLVGLLAAGLFLIHLRVFIYFLPFPLLVWAGSRARRTGWLVAGGALALVLVAPRIWYLFPRSRPIAEVLSTSEESYNAFPMGYITAGWERYFIGLAAVALLVVLVAALRRQRWAAFPLALGLWVGTLFLMLAGRRFGLPETWLVNLNSMYITLFLQLALLLGMAGDWLWRGLAGNGATRSLRFAGLGAGLVGALLFGVRHQVTVLNPQTILAEEPDRAALAWMEANLPESARVAVSSWPWLGGTWSGSDGGAWILPVTGLETTTPPADYSYSAELHRSVAEFNEAANAIEDWSDPASAEWLRGEGVTHLYVGARGGFLDPAELARNPALRLLHQHEGTFVFEVGAGGEE